MIGFILAGLVIGALARLLKPGRQHLGVIATLLLSVVGSVIGGSIASLIGTGDIMELNVLGFVFAVIASILLLGVAETMSGRKEGA
ncbi:MAG: GlsB/YeaQ/YmgE family stress response membrane protein [Actinomycetota bacterium]